MMTTEQMKAELEAEGYRLEMLRGEYTRTPVFIAPDGLVIGGQLGLEDTHLPEYAEFKSIRYAYTHLQERKELKALRAFVLADAKEYESIGGNAFVKGEAQELIEKYNITADDESDDDESI